MPAPELGATWAPAMDCGGVWAYLSCKKVVFEGVNQSLAVVDQHGVGRLERAEDEAAAVVHRQAVGEAVGLRPRGGDELRRRVGGVGAGEGAERVADEADVAARRD